MRSKARDRQQPQISWAQVNGASGSVGGGSGDLTIARTATGVYTVQLPKAQTGITYTPFVSVASIGAGGAHGVAVNTATTSGFTVWTFVANTGVSFDVNFSVMVLWNA